MKTADERVQILPCGHEQACIYQADVERAIRAAQEEMREEAAALMESGNFCRMVEHIQHMCECEERAAAIRKIEVK